jgi:hypothetical protein
MARTLRRLAVLALAAALAALLVAGCGGGDSGGGGADQTEGLSAQELLDRSAAEFAKLDTFRIVLDGNGRVALAPGSSVPGASLLNGPVAFSGEGPVDPPDKASIDAKLELAALSPQVNITRVGDGVYVGILGQDFKLALPASTVALLDFGRLYPTLTGWISDPQRSAGEDIDGAPTVKVTGALDAQKALADLGPLLTGGGGVPAADTAQLRKALKEGTVEAWIGTEDLRPRRVHLVLKASGLTGLPVRSIDVDLTTTFSAFDEPADISAPANARPLDLNSLGSLTGP